MENLSTFQGKGGGENEKLMFLVQKRGADLARALEKGGAELSDMALRFDHTVPLRALLRDPPHRAPRGFQALPSRVGVARGPAAARSLPRVHAVRHRRAGLSSPMVEAEVILVTATALVQLGFSDITVRLNSRPLLDALVRSFGVPASHVNTTFVAIDKLDKVSVADVEKELVEKGVPAEAVSRDARVSDVRGRRARLRSTMSRSRLATAVALSSISCERSSPSRRPFLPGVWSSTPSWPVASTTTRALSSRSSPRTFHPSPATRPA